MLNKEHTTPINSIFSTIIFWFSLVSLLLIVISSLSTYYSMNQVIVVTQDRRVIALGKGLALTASDSIVTKDYGQLENDIRKVMSNETLRSAVVTDLKGTVLAFVSRNEFSESAKANYSIGHIDPPKDQHAVYSLEQNTDMVTLWYRVDAGIPLAWIRLESFTNFGDGLLHRLRRNALFAVISLFVILVGTAMVFFYRAKKKSQDQERQLMQANRRLYEAAHLDTLTKLPNRLSLSPLLNAAMEAARTAQDAVAICLLDLDGFKKVNDSLGHLSGDHLLIAVAGRMKKAVRESDSVIRLGGDEFVLILGGIKSPEQLNVLLKRILELIAAPFRIDGHSVAISASIGVSVYPKDDASTISDLLSHADSAMYEAKKHGKNNWIFYEKNPSELNERTI